jgi:hypothetical protein
MLWPWTCQNPAHLAHSPPCPGIPEPCALHKDSNEGPEVSMWHSHTAHLMHGLQCGRKKVKKQKLTKPSPLSQKVESIRLVGNCCQPQPHLTNRSCMHPCWELPLCASLPTAEACHRSRHLTKDCTQITIILGEGKATSENGGSVRLANWGSKAVVYQLW